MQNYFYSSGFILAHCLEKALGHPWTDAISGLEIAAEQ